MRNIKARGLKVFAFLTLVSILLPSLSFAQEDGEKLFKTYCSACHMPTEKKLIGPGLAGVEERWEDRGLLYQWIKNSQSVLDMGDPYATALFEEYNKSIMPAQPVNDEQIDAILDYINNPPAAEAVADVAAGGGELAAAQEEKPVIDYWVIALVVVVLLLVLLGMLRNLKYALVKIQAEKDGKEAPAQESMLQSVNSWINSNKTFFAILCIVAAVGVAKLGWDWLLNVGIYQGYAPEQPIKFSHALHAGTQKIDCQYCHHAARNSKSAGIPTSNVCMNCHTYIQEGPSTGTEEIGKIYAANGWNAEEQAYSNESEGPIKWVKIHNLPDHAYFNHSQHVSVGKIACQTCHGPVEEMEVVAQHAPLTMGWCINCHRETKVNDADNGYYEEFHARLTDELKEEYIQDGKLTVEEIGGLECAKCHY